MISLNLQENSWGQSDTSKPAECADWEHGRAVGVTKPSDHAYFLAEIG